MYRASYSIVYCRAPDDGREIRPQHAEQEENNEIK